MVTKVKQVIENATEEAERNPLLGAARKVLLAGIGAVALAQDEAEDFVNKLVERGQIAEQDGKKLLRDLVERRKKGAARAEEELDRRVEELLNRLNVPTRADIEALASQIAELDRKLDELKK
jgi:polyhydroxyalkanoate synthesis regulator phasin